MISFVHWLVPCKEAQFCARTGGSKHLFFAQRRINGLTRVDVGIYKVGISR